MNELDKEWGRLMQAQIDQERCNTLVIAKLDTITKGVNDLQVELAVMKADFASHKVDHANIVPKTTLAAATALLLLAGTVIGMLRFFT
jgi:hypothetical protein